MKILNYVLVLLLATSFVSCSEEDLLDTSTTKSCTINGQAVNCDDVTVSVQSNAYYSVEEDETGSYTISMSGVEESDTDSYGNTCYVGVDGDEEFSAYVSDDGSKLYFGPKNSGNKAVMQRVGPMNSEKPLVGEWRASQNGMTLTLIFNEFDEVIFKNKCTFKGHF